MAEGERRPLRVLYLNHVAQISGAENSLLALVRHLDRRRVRPVAAVPPGPLARELRHQGVQVTTVRELRLQRPAGLLGGARTALGLRWWARAVWRAGRALNCDLVHANSLTAGIAARLAFGESLPLVWHARDLRMPGRAEAWLLERATRIIAISACVANHLFEARPQARERTVLIYNGIEPRDFQPRRSRQQVRLELGIPEDCPLVGTVGQIVPWKRQELVLEVAANVIAHLPQCRFLIVGADLFGEHVEYVRRLHALAARLNVAGNVTFTGYRQDAASVLAALDVLVHPADREPLGRVVLEAMSLGVPCVAADSCGPSELVQDGVSGLLVTPGDVDGFAREIRNLLQRPATARRIGEAARRRVGESFSAERMARLTEDLYEEAMAEARLS